MVIFTLYYIKCQELSLIYNVLVGFKGLDERRGHVVDSKDNLSDTGLGQGLDLVAENGLVAEEHEGFGDAECQGSQACAITSDENKSLHRFVFIFN